MQFNSWCAKALYNLSYRSLRVQQLADSKINWVSYCLHRYNVFASIQIWNDSEHDERKCNEGHKKNCQAARPGSLHSCHARTSKRPGNAYAFRRHSELYCTPWQAMHAKTLSGTVESMTLYAL